MTGCSSGLTTMGVSFESEAWWTQGRKDTTCINSFFFFGCLLAHRPEGHRSLDRGTLSFVWKQRTKKNAYIPIQQSTFFPMIKRALSHFPMNRLRTLGNCNRLATTPLLGRAVHSDDAQCRIRSKVVNRQHSPSVPPTLHIQYLWRRRKRSGFVQSGPRFPDLYFRSASRL